MKNIPLKTVEVEDGSKLMYDEIIRSVVRQPLDPQKGVGIDEMRKGIRILDKLDASTEVLELEDADYNHLKEKVEGMTWGMVDRNLMGFIDTVLNANGQVT